MTHEDMPLDPDWLDDAIDQHVHREESNLPVDSPDMRLLADLRRMYRSGEEDAQSLAQVYLRLRAHVGASRRSWEQVTPTVPSSERITMRPVHGPSSNARTAPDALQVAQPSAGRHALAGVIAVVALIALSAGIFSYFAIHGGSHRSAIAATPHPACAPAHATVDLPAHVTLTSIAPVGTEDGWAVGNVGDPSQPASPPSAVMLRLHNCHWAPVGAPLQKAQLSAISMVSADDGWAVGAMMTLDTTPLSNGQPANVWEASQPLALHYTHGSWQTVTVAAGPKTSAEQVKMVSATEGWMLLYDGKHLVTVNGVNGLRYGYLLQHYLNGTWTNVPLDFLKPLMIVSDLDARAPGEVWLVGNNNNRANGSYALAAHYADGVWTTYTNLAIDAHSDSFESVSEVSPTDVWAAGTGLYHFDGARWTRASLQGAISGVAGSFTPLISEIDMLSPSEGWAFPSWAMSLSLTQLQGKALRYSHGVWHWTTLQISGAPAPMPIVDFAQSSPTQGWALGLQTASDHDLETVLLSYDGGDWAVVPQQA